jgi:PTS system cellobiose-specific IIB component
MSAVDFYEDAQDAIEGWKETGMNPFHFEGEQTAIKVMRTVSHRKYMASK